MASKFFSILTLSTSLLIACGISLSSAHAGTPTESRIERLLDRMMRQSALPVVVAGKKPFFFDYHMDTDDIGGGPSDWIHWLDDAYSKGILTNSDLVYYFDGNEILFASRNALSKLTENASANLILSRNQIVPPKSVDEWITLRKSTQDAFRSGDLSAKMRADIIVGLSAGYPPLEVEAWAKEMTKKRQLALDGVQTDIKPALSSVRVSTLEGSNGGRTVLGYGKYVNKGFTEEETAFIKDARRMMRNYTVARKQGIGVVELINAPHLLVNVCPLYLRPTVKP